MIGNKFGNILLLFLIILFNQLRAEGANEKELKKEIRHDNVQAVLEYLNGSGDPNALIGPKDYSLLFYSVKYDSEDVAKLLLKYGADPDYKVKGKNLLMWTVRYNNPDISRILLEYGADVNARGKKGNTPLIMAVWRNETDFIKLFLNYGADPYQKDEYGNTTIDYSHYKEREESGYYLDQLIKKWSKIEPRSYYHDGPHIKWLDDTTIMVSYFYYNSLDDAVERVNKIVPFKGDSLVFNGFSYDTNHYTLYRYPFIGNEVFSNVSKIFAVNDIHGNYQSFIKLLKVNHIIDENLNWSWGKGHLVVVGDVFDRGEDVTETLWLIYKLERQALYAGGYVHFLLGNHEIMILRGKAYYLADKYNYFRYRLALDYPSLFLHSYELGKWLRKKKTMVKINNDLFVHGGISPEIYNFKYDITYINRLTTALLSKMMNQELTDEEEKLISKAGPFWYRGYALNCGNKDIISVDILDSIMDFYGLSHIIIGHTLLEDIQVLLDDKVIVISSPFQEQRLESFGLLIRNRKYYKLNSDGKSKEIL